MGFVGISGSCRGFLTFSLHSHWAQDSGSRNPWYVGGVMHWHASYSSF